MNSKRTFRPEPTSVPAVRRFVIGSLDQVPPATIEAVRLMVSELATNAVLYAATDFQVTVQTSDESLFVAITDHGRGTPEIQVCPEPSQPHGRGLIIVRDLADEWGVIAANDETGKTVWFRIRLREREDSLM